MHTTHCPCVDVLNKSHSTGCLVVVIFTTTNVSGISGAIFPIYEEPDVLARDWHVICICSPRPAPFLQSVCCHVRACVTLVCAGFCGHCHQASVSLAFFSFTHLYSLARQEAVVPFCCLTFRIPVKQSDSQTFPPLFIFIINLFHVSQHTGKQLTVGLGGEK